MSSVDQGPVPHSLITVKEMLNYPQTNYIYRLTPLTLSVPVSIKSLGSVPNYINKNYTRPVPLAYFNSIYISGYYITQFKLSTGKVYNN